MTDPSAELEETRRFNADLEQVLATLPATYDVPPAVTRQARVEGRGVFPAPEVVAEAVDRTIPDRHGNPLGVRVFVPPGGIDGVYLHCHGGGWVLGAANQQDVALWKLARHARVAVVSVDYHLAPEHPYPRPLNDCEDAAVWLVREGAADLGGPGPLLIGGESAGGHLAACTLLRLRDRHGAADRFVGANLVFGVFDLSMTPSQLSWGARPTIIDTPTMAWFYDCLLPGRELGERRHPDVSPLYADLSGLPPALFTVGTKDPLLDDTLFMEARWRQAGNATELAVFEEAMHGFTAFPTLAARRAVDTQIAFVRRCLCS